MAELGIAGVIHIEGLADLQSALRRSNEAAARGLKDALIETAEPVRVEAQLLAIAEIPNMTLDWSQMRTGATDKYVYVVPRKRGTKVPRKKRKNLKDKLLDEAMTPALANNLPEVERRVEALGNTILATYGAA